MTALGDVNDDGYADAAIAYPASTAAYTAGRVDILLGGPEGFSAPTSLVGSGDAQGAFGAGIAAGDFDGDGFGDVVIGAPGEADQLGRLYVFRGGPRGIQGSPAWTYTASAPSQSRALFGSLVGSADFNGDGVDDVVVGNVDGGFLVFSGETSTVSNTPVVIAPLRTKAPTAISASQDLNGDGFGDVIVGFQGDSATILLGSASGLASTGALLFGYGTAGFGSSISR